MRDTSRDVSAEIIEHPANAEHKDQFISIVESLVNSPNPNIDVLERMLDIRDREIAMQSQRAFTVDFTAMQSKMPIVDKLARTNNASYARWEHIYEIIMPVLSEHGFSLSFRNVTPTTPGGVRIQARLVHRAGHIETNEMESGADTSGSKNAIQAQASSRSYLKRYTACELLNIATRNEDDDGVGAKTELLSDDQDASIRRLIKQSGADVNLFLKNFRVESVSDLLAKDFVRATSMLTRKIAEAK